MKINMDRRRAVARQHRSEVSRFPGSAGFSYSLHSIIKMTLLLLIACAVLIVMVKASRATAGPFALAADCPRGALVYAQFADLPALIKQWDESQLKQQYLASASFQQLTGRHLALKLAERWAEFNSALGFPLDTAVFSSATDHRAALAVYDIGRLEMIFIAPLSEEKLAAVRFFQNRDQFQEQTLPDGTAYYLREIEADHGRQKQEIAFASVSGRFVLASSEKLLWRAIACLNGKAPKDRLTADPAFAQLSRETQPHLITVWLDQTKLNRDWYFRHYWIQRNADELGQLRAGMLDFEMLEGRWIEHRNFLLTGDNHRQRAVIAPAELQRLARFIPQETPYLRVRALDRDLPAVADLIRDTFFNRDPETKKTAQGWNRRDEDLDDFERDGDAGWRRDRSNYAYLDDHYDQTINDEADAGVNIDQPTEDIQFRRENERRAAAGLQQSLEPAHPVCAATIANQRAVPGPLFAQTTRAVIISLSQPARFRPEAFEQSLADLASRSLVITGSNIRREWHSHQADGLEWRELKLPLLGWRLCYARQGRELIVASQPELLVAMLSEKQGTSVPESGSAAQVNELTVIRLAQRQTAFDHIVGKLDAQRTRASREARGGDNSQAESPSPEFFSGNLVSLFETASRLNAVCISRSQPPGRLREDVAFSFK